LLDYGFGRVLFAGGPLRRALGASPQPRWTVAVLTSGDMDGHRTAADRTYAEDRIYSTVWDAGQEEQPSSRLPPLVVLGLLILITGRALGRFDDGRALVSSFHRAGCGTWAVGGL